jgi:hypothetical protein
MMEFVSWDDAISNIWKVIKHMFQTPIQLAITGDKNSGTHGTPWRLEDINNDKQTHGFEHKKHKVSMNFHNEIC